MPSNSLVYVFLNPFPSLSANNFKRWKETKKKKEKMLKRLGFRIECKSFTLNGKMQN